MGGDSRTKVDGCLVRNDLGVRDGLLLGSLEYSDGKRYGGGGQGLSLGKSGQHETLSWWESEDARTAHSPRSTFILERKDALMACRMGHESKRALHFYRRDRGPSKGEGENHRARTREP